MGELEQFVKESLKLGKSRDEIRQVLSQAGWAEDEVEEALARFAEIPFDIPVPLRRTSGSARDAFLYMVTLLMLYTAAISLGNLLCAFVDKAIPDPVQEPYYYDSSYESDGLRWLIASLIISFPTWFLMTRSHLISYAKNPERRASPVRRWLTYLTLFVAATTVLVTLIVLLAGALSGEHIARTAIKSAIVLVIAGGIFGFYLWELRLGDRKAVK